VERRRRKLTNINLLQKALDASSLRQQVISNNISNAETPGYKAKQVVFEDILKKHLTNQTNFEGNRSDARHLVIGRPSIIPSPSVVENTNTVMQNSGNNVDIDEEMTRMGKNSLWYYTLTEQINSEFQQLSIAIKGRS
jgi:flagellar basal-body rod protein FlgB